MIRLGFAVAALCAALACAACGGDGGGYQDSYNVPPGSDPPFGSSGTYTDAAGRLYALVRSSGGGATLVVVAGRDGSSVGSLPFTGLAPDGIALASDGRVYVPDAAADVVHVVTPDGGFGSSSVTTTDPRAIAANGAALAVVSDAELTLSGVFAPIALPPGGAPESAAFSRAGSLLAIGRDAPADVVLVSIGSLVSVAAPATLLSPDGCEPRLDDVTFARFGSASSWYAVDTACGYLYRGGATQNTAATVAFAAPAPALGASDRLEVDGWTGRVWIADGAGLTLVAGTAADPVPGVSGGTTSVALANAGTIGWVAATSSGGAPTLMQVGAAGSVSALATVGPPGSSVQALAYLDRPPYFTGLLDVHGENCDVATVSLAPSVDDPDGDPVDVWFADAYGGEDFTIEDGVLTATYYDSGDGPDGWVRFEAMSGYFFAYAQIAIYVSECDPPEDDQDDDEDDDGGGCACRCTVAPPHGAPPPTGPAILCALVGLAGLRWRRTHA